MKSKKYKFEIYLSDELIESAKEEVELRNKNNPDRDWKLNDLLMAMAVTGIEKRIKECEDDRRKL